MACPGAVPALGDHRPGTADFGHLPLVHKHQSASHNGNADQKPDDTGALPANERDGRPTGAGGAQERRVATQCHTGRSDRPTGGDV